jgi:RNA polymerase sigma-70 factor (ECF subfamily)
MDELELISAARNGDLDAFNDLVRSYERRVYSICSRMLGDADLAADVTQETFFAAWRNLSRFQGHHFRAWILRIATNACYDVLRSRKWRNLVSLDRPHDDSSIPLGWMLPAVGESPDSRVVRHELGATIRHCIAELPADQRIVVILSDIEGMRYDEIAAATGTNLGTVKSRLSRGRARLRALLHYSEALPLMPVLSGEC